MEYLVDHDALTGLLNARHFEQAVMRGTRLSARYGGGEGGSSDTVMFDAAYGMTSPGASVGLMFQRHAFDYGTSTDALAHLAVNNRKNAALNPAAACSANLIAECS